MLVMIKKCWAMLFREFVVFITSSHSILTRRDDKTICPRNCSSYIKYTWVLFCQKRNPKLILVFFDRLLQEKNDCVDSVMLRSSGKKKGVADVAIKLLFKRGISFCPFRKVHSIHKTPTGVSQLID